MSQIAGVRTRHLNRARFQTDAHPIPAPSCLGGAHRRCLLQADTCCCPCHRGDDPTAKPPHVEAEFRCAACGIVFETRWMRVEHFRVSHPVDTKEHDVNSCTVDDCEICYADKPTSVQHPRGIYRCRICHNQPFLSEPALLEHQAIAHGAPWPPPKDAA